MKLPVVSLTHDEISHFMKWWIIKPAKQVKCDIFTQTLLKSHFCNKKWWWSCQVAQSKQCWIKAPGTVQLSEPDVKTTRLLFIFWFKKSHVLCGVCYGQQFAVGIAKLHRPLCPLLGCSPMQGSHSNNRLQSTPQQRYSRQSVIWEQAAFPKSPPRN